MKKLTERVAATGQLLMRSGIEIARLLQQVCDSGAPLSASLASGELLFLSRMLRVDPQAGHLVMACSDVKQANSALLAAPVVVFGCTHDGVRYEFAGGAAAEAFHQGRPALRVAFPPTVLALQRRSKPRLVIPPRTAITCTVRLGALSFEAQLADITVDGLGAIVYDPGIRLAPGITLRGVEIQLGRRSVRLDLEVTHFTRVPAGDGAWAMRAGCKVKGASAELETLVSHFLKALEADS